MEITEKVSKAHKVKKIEFIEKEIEVEVHGINWSRVKKGTYFTAKIGGKKAIGRIQKCDGDIVFCQNVIGDDDIVCLDTLYNMKYDFWVGEGGMDELKDYEVTDIRLFTDPPPGFKEYGPLVTIEIDDDTKRIVFERGKIRIGCTTITNKKIREIYDQLK